MIREGNIPQVRALACNNGLLWNEAAEQTISQEGFGNQVTWEHVNHDRLVMIFQRAKPVNDALQLTGAAIIEDLHFSRVLVARIAATEVAALIQRKLPDPPIQLVHSKEVCSYVGIVAKTLYRCEKQGMILAYKKDHTAKYFLHADMVLFKKKYHNLSDF